MHELVSRLVSLRREEMPSLALAFSWFSCILLGYYAIRPVRETVATGITPDALQQLSLAAFVVMLVAAPIYSGLVATFRRHTLVRIIYRFLRFA